MDANYIALTILNEAMRDALSKATRGIEQAGSLDSKDAKLNESAKEYFKAQTEEYKKTITILQGIHKEINARMWASL